MKTKNIIICIIACTLLIFKLSAQNNKKAEALFENTFPLAFNVGIQTMSYNKSGDSGPFAHDLNNLWMPEFGLKYNVLQKNNFNFNTGIHIRSMKYTHFIYSNTDRESIFNPEKNQANDITYHIPLTAEYIVHSSESTSYVAHVGYELQYYRYSHLWAHNQTIEVPNSSGIVNVYGKAFPKEFSHGINLGAGLYKKLGNQLLKFEINYQLHLTQLMENRLTATNFPNQPDYEHKINWNGNHVAAKLIYYPFRKSKK